MYIYKLTILRIEIYINSGDQYITKVDDNHRMETKEHFLHVFTVDYGFTALLMCLDMFFSPWAQSSPCNQHLKTITYRTINNQDSM